MVSAIAALGLVSLLSCGMYYVLDRNARACASREAFSAKARNASAEDLLRGVEVTFTGSAQSLGQL